MKISAREILKENELKIKLKECFKRCAAGRQQLRRCVFRSMDEGLSKGEILKIIIEMSDSVDQNEMSLCYMVAMGQTMRYEAENKVKKHIKLSKDEKKNLKNTLLGCLKKCGLARKQLRNCITCALNMGLSAEDVLIFTDEIVGGVGRDDVSLCGIIAVDQVLRHERNLRKKPIDMTTEFFGVE